LIAADDEAAPGLGRALGLVLRVEEGEISECFSSALRLERTSCRERWTYDGHEARDAADAETGKNPADRKKRDVGRRRLHRDAGAEQDEVAPDADAATKLAADRAGADGADEGTGGEDRGLREGRVSVARACAAPSESSEQRRTMSESVEVLSTYSPLAWRSP